MIYGVLSFTLLDRRQLEGINGRATLAAKLQLKASPYRIERLKERG